jgi:hypothetical protein
MLPLRRARASPAWLRGLSLTTDAGTLASALEPLLLGTASQMRGGPKADDLDAAITALMGLWDGHKTRRPTEGLAVS